MRAFHSTGLVILAFLVCATSLPAQEWTGRGRLRGKVVDTSGQPVAKASIAIQFRGQEGLGPRGVQSDKKGRWAFIGLASGGYLVKISKDGYETATARTEILEASPMLQEPIDTTLRTLDEAGAEAAARGGGPLAETVERANALLDAGDYSGARALYEEVAAQVQTDEQRTEIRRAIASTYFGAEDWPAARAIYAEMLAEASTDGHRVELLEKIARTHYRAGEVDEAVATLDRALEIEPESASALGLAIDMLASAGRGDDAQKYMSQVPEGQTVDATVTLNLGINAYNNGDLDTAERHFREVERAHPDEVLTPFYLGLVHLGRGTNDAARESFNAFLEAAPDHEKADEAREFLGFLDSP